MNHLQITEVYKAVTGAGNLCHGKVSVIVETGEAIQEHETLIAIIKKFQQKQGWLCYQSDVLTLIEGKELPATEERILYGELVNKDDESLHIQQAGDRWWVTRIKEGNGESCLIKSQCYYISESEKAYYHVYWKYSDNGYQPDSYRFVGFVDKKEVS